MRNTLTIPTPGIGSPAGENTVLDIDEISLVQQSSDTSTTIYTQKASGGDVTLTHSTASGGSVGNAINESLLASPGGSAILTLPSGVEITSITFS
jgi:hypothetical protein